MTTKMMTLLLSYFIIVSTIVAAAEVTTNLQECITDDDTNDDQTDYFPEKVSVDHSEHWSIEYQKTYKILKSTYVSKSYLLYPCGMDPPLPSDLIENNNEQHHVTLPVPHKGGIGITSTTQIPHLELLGKTREIKAFFGNPNTISSSCLLELIDSGNTKVFYDPADPYNSTKQGIDMDMWLDENPDAIVLVGSFGDSSTKPRRVAITESREGLNKAIFEWHKFYGALFNLESMATSTFDTTEDRYDCITTNAATISSDMMTSDSPEDRSPTILLWAYYSTFVKGWDVAKCEPSERYYCEFARHCSVSLLHSNEGSIEAFGSKYMTDEEFMEFGKDADIWIYPSSDFNDIYASNKDMLDNFKSVMDEEVYDNQGQGQTAWFEQRLVEYDVVLQDMCALTRMSPSMTTTPLHVRRWFRNVFTEAAGTPSPVCEDIDAPLVTGATECTIVDANALNDSSGGGGDNFVSLMMMSLVMILSVLFLF